MTFLTQPKTSADKTTLPAIVSMLNDAVVQCRVIAQINTHDDDFPPVSVSLPVNLSRRTSTRSEHASHHIIDRLLDDIVKRNRHSITRVQWPRPALFLLNCDLDL